LAEYNYWKEDAPWVAGIPGEIRCVRCNGLPKQHSADCKWAHTNKEVVVNPAYPMIYDHETGVVWYDVPYSKPGPKLRPAKTIYLENIDRRFGQVALMFDTGNYRTKSLTREELEQFI
jgi:hypothetical protein